MSLDIVEIALDQLTDHRGFEKMACEVMRDVGYPDIRPLGGSGDLGRDAVLEETLFLSEKPNRTIFQFTIQDDIAGKVDETIDKLRANELEFVALVVGCRRRLSTESQDSIERAARLKYGVSVRLFERASFVLRLADFQNGIFHRHFPSIRAQVSLIEEQQRSPEKMLRDTEKGLLQTSLLMTFGDDASATRRSLFDSLVLAVLLEQPGRRTKRVSFGAVVGQAVSIPPPPDDQIGAAIHRLQEAGLVQIDATEARATEKAVAKVAGTHVRASCAKDIVADDVVSRVRSSHRNRLSEADVRKIQRNTVDTVLRLFRAYGIHFASQLLARQRDVALPLALRAELLETARYQLAPPLGELVVAAIGDLLRDPGSSVAQALAAWTRAYLAAQIMGLDPTLHELHAQKMKGKVFLLDTDTLLAALATGCPEIASTKAVIESLVKYQCRVIIPESSIAEGARHAQYSVKTYNYFKERLLRLPPAFVDRHVNNVFVRAYFYASTTGLVPANHRYSDFLANFFDDGNPVGFFREVVRDSLPAGVEILEPGALLEAPVGPERVDALTEVLLDLLSRSRKAKYRTPEEQHGLARADASLFLTALELTASRANDFRGILGGRCYLVTDSARYLKASRSAGLSDVVTTRPQSLIALFQLVGGATVSPSDFVRLFDNTFLSEAVEHCRADIDKLVSTGIDLHTMSITRLRFDLDEALHEGILKLEAAEAIADEDSESDDGDPSGTSDAYMDLLSEATRRGYGLIPEVTKLKKAVDESQASAIEREVLIDRLLEENKSLEEQIEHFGRKKQRYIRRMRNMHDRKGPPGSIVK